MRSSTVSTWQRQHACLTHFPSWRAEHCGFLQPHYPALVCRSVSCVDGSYSLLTGSNSHWHALISEVLFSRLDEIKERKQHRRVNPSISPLYLLSWGSGEDKGGKNREGVFGVRRPALDCCPHREAEERDRLWQREWLIVLLRISAE